jgi:hypothetical protein
LYEDTTRVWERGAVKYSAWNWASGQPWSVPLDSMFRHLLAISNGESIDIESKLPHVAHILCNAIMLYHFVEHYPQLNDLPPQHFFDVASPEDAS